jgi:phosphoenolpyruvate phosphomutase
VIYVHGHWRGVNDLEEFGQAVEFAQEQEGYGAGATPQDRR